MTPAVVVPPREHTGRMSEPDLSRFAQEIRETGDEQMRQLRRLNAAFGGEWMADVASDAIRERDPRVILRRDGKPRTIGAIFFRLARVRLYAMQRARLLRWEAIGWFFSPVETPVPLMVPEPREKGPAQREPTGRRVKAPAPERKPRTGLPRAPAGDAYVGRGRGGTFGTGRETKAPRRQAVAPEVYHTIRRG